MTTRSGRAWRLTLLLTCVLLAYGPALEAGFVWDDDDYVTANPLLREGSPLSRIWLEPRSLPQYYPLVHTTYWLEYRLWGLTPLGYHLTNILLHTASSLLLWRLLGRLGLGAAFPIALAFAVHPVAVESVAWITERKNTLALLFSLISLDLWLGWRAVAATELRRPARYGLCVLAYAAALLSKTIACCVPALMLIDVWRRDGRVTWRDLARVLPFLLLGAGLAWVTVHLESTHVIGRGGSDWDLSVVQRALIAGRAVWFYVGTILWPIGLCFSYPRWDVGPADVAGWLGLIACAATLLGLWLARGRIGRAPLATALAFLATLAPALGFFDIYPMRYTYVADHYAYLALPILLAAVASAIEAAWRRWQPPRRLGLAALVVVLSASTLLSHRQSRSYHDRETLWRACIATSPRSYLAQANLGGLLLDRGELAAALPHLDAALALREDFAEAHSNRGKLAYLQGDMQRAATHLRRALALQPWRAELHNNVGAVLEGLGQLDVATTHYRRALELTPRYPDALANLGELAHRRGDWAEAVQRLTQLLALRSADPARRLLLAQALERLSRPSEALAAYLQVAGNRPGSSPAWQGAARTALACNDARAAPLALRALTLEPSTATREVAAQALLSELRGLDDGAVAGRVQARCAAVAYFDAALVQDVSRRLRRSGRPNAARELEVLAQRWAR